MHGQQNIKKSREIVSLHIHSHEGMQIKTG